MFKLFRVLQCLLFGHRYVRIGEKRWNNGADRAVFYFCDRCDDEMCRDVNSYK